MVRYVIPAIPPSENAFKGRQNHWEYRSLKKEWEQMVAVYCRPRQHFDKCKLTFRYYFPTRVRHDPNNYSGQFLTDGLVKAGIITDDDFGHITLILEGDYDKDNPRTEIYLEEE